MLQGIRLIAQPGPEALRPDPASHQHRRLLGRHLVRHDAFEGLMQRMQSAVPDWLGWLEWLLWPVFILALLIIVFYSFTLIANLIASPFNGLLAEKTEALLTGRSLADNNDMKKLLRELPVTCLKRPARCSTPSSGAFRS
jgi:CysZ protein